MGRKISLVLGSGGARGYAHIGAIEAFLDAGYEIASVSGCSMGALVGGIYACGNLSEFKEWVLGLDILGVLRLVDITIAHGGAIKGEKVFEKMERFFAARSIEELPIRYTAVATDLDGKKEIWFQQGDLRSAIRASIAIPTVFTPVYHNGRALVDGGVLNPLPIAPTMSDHTDLIAAVNLSASYASLQNRAAKPQATEKRTLTRQFLEKLGVKKESDPIAEKIGRLEILQRVIEVMQDTITLHKIASNAPDILVDIPFDSCRAYDFHKAKEMIALGYAATKDAIAAYEARLEI